uniref:NADH dehydrogenase subunit 4 n=1 Tax=Glaucosphaera vacuolata TaxID=38265 RepID=UPI001FCD176E|nr:NADH dehydrogenase subunit 4 [Glaucosphaera vacuolata]UNJ18767.1 NADH dehydrogenase subunit 4 [Glaucosphaera vacuolata]
MTISSIFLFLLSGPFLGALFISILPSKDENLQKSIALFISCIIFLTSLLLWLLFDSNTSFFQYLLTLRWFSILKINYILGIDGISLFFVLLTTFLIPFCILVSWGSVENYLKEYLISFLILEGLLLQVFCVLDLLLFYIFFESVLLPMFFIIGIWGSRQRKIRAAYQFFLYTLIGSLLMLLALLFIYFETGTTDLQILWHIEFSESRQLLLWLAFFASFAVKVPMIPFHIWLPEAHAEAPTAGSVILAGVLLKLGGYGFLRFSLLLFPIASIYFTPFIFVLSIVASIYASLTTLRQIDLKKAIAYSSVAHMGLVTLGIFSGCILSLQGSIYLMLSHGLVSSALFLCVGILYDRYKTRIIKYYGGLTQCMPLFSVFFLFFSFANLGFPGTSSFVGEFTVLLGVFFSQISACFFAALSMVLAAAYSIWLFNRVCCGSLKYFYINEFQDVSRREFWILIPLVVTVVWMGIYSSIFFTVMQVSTFNYVVF